MPRLVDHPCARTGNSALMLLCSRGRRDCNRDAVAALLGHGGGALAPNLNARNARDGRTALMLACSFGHMECVRLLLAHGSGGSGGSAHSTRLAIDMQDHDGLTALMHCSSSAHVDIARLLLSSQPPPDMTLRSATGATAIALARSPEMKRYLTFWKGPELLAAAAAGDLASVVALLQTGTDVDYQSVQTGATALLVACANGRFACARHILANRPAPALFVRDADGMDALHRASAGDHQECAHLLLNVANQAR
jgi:ankyrin repeat protein